MNAEAQLKELRFELPEVPKPVGEFVLPKCLSIVLSGVPSFSLLEE